MYRTLGQATKPRFVLHAIVIRLENELIAVPVDLASLDYAKLALLEESHTTQVELNFEKNLAFSISIKQSQYRSKRTLVVLMMLCDGIVPFSVQAVSIPEWELLHCCRIYQLQ
jgi:hypothetical protein